MNIDDEIKEALKEVFGISLGSEKFEVTKLKENITIDDHVKEFKEDGCGPYILIGIKPLDEETGRIQIRTNLDLEVATAFILDRTAKAHKQELMLKTKQRKNEAEMAKLDMPMFD